MINTQLNNEQHNAIKLPYQTPEITDFGAIEAVTQSGAASNNGVPFIADPTVSNPLCYYTAC